MKRFHSFRIFAWALFFFAAAAATAVAAPPPNIVFVLCDDHRFDCLGVEGHPFLETPHLDKLARDGQIASRAYVTTSLCSPSRASILTGLYAHNHRVVDNYHPVDPALTFFPQRLQSAGYRTAFIGKWHMGGESDEPRKGFDHWIAFKGQGTYWPDGHGTTREVPQTTYDGLNINGKRVPQTGYITDELTDYAVDWLQSLDDDEPFFLYVSHKAVHADFVPADRHRGRYDNEPIPITVPSPQSMAEGNLPMWVRDQRNSRHGVDFGYNLHDFDPSVYYRRYCESLLAVDESVGRLRERIEELGRTQNTLFVYMGDNGFQFGDHGLIDKRVAYEASSRVPLIFAGPGIAASDSESPRRYEPLIGNIDIAPTLLAAAGAEPLEDVDGISAWNSLAGNQADPPRQDLLYEYYWERNYPHTPTLHAVLGGRFKYIRVHGVWDRDELYDLRTDPAEMRNLIAEPGLASVRDQLSTRLWQLLQKRGDAEMPLLPDRGPVFPLRDSTKTPPANFPDPWLIEPPSAAAKSNGE